MIYTIFILILLILSFVFHNIFDSFVLSIIKTNSHQNDENLKKRMKKSKCILFLLLFWEILEFSIIYLIFVLFLFIFFIKKEDWVLKNQLNKETKRLKFQFPIWLRQLQILLQTNTVSQSLKLSYEHAPQLIKNDLKILIQEIDQDALNITPYLNFLSNYRLNEIERAMKLLYRYNTVGKEDAYIQFNRMIQTTTKWLRSERDEHHKNSLAIYEWVSMVPLVGVTILFLAIMFEVIMSMFSNGI